MSCHIIVCRFNFALKKYVAIEICYKMSHIEVNVFSKIIGRKENIDDQMKVKKGSDNE
jgi:hypothetical protein